MKRTFKFISIFLILMMSMSVLTSCGPKEEQSGDDQTVEEDTDQTSDTGTTDEELPENSWEIDTSPVTLEIFVDMAGRDFNQNWGKDEVSKKMIEETGVNIEFNIAPDNVHKKLNLLIAGDDLPDMVYWDTEVPHGKKLADNDRIYALNKLAEDADAVNFMDNFGKHVIVAKRIRYQSMDYYAAPFFHTPKKGWDKPFIARNMSGVTMQDKIYEELGSPKIETADDYIEMCKQVKEKYPDLTPVQTMRKPSPSKEGDPILVERSLAFAGLYQKYFKQGDKYVKYWQHPDFIKVLKFANRLFNEGLIDRTEFTDKKSQLKAKLFNGDVYSELCQDADNIDKFTAQMHKVKPDTNYMMIDPFVLEPGMEYAMDSFEGGIGHLEILITKNCENPERAIRWLDYLYQPKTQKRIIYGLEGSAHEMVDGVPEYTEDYLKAEVEQGKNTNLYGCYNYWLCAAMFIMRLMGMASVCL